MRVTELMYDPVAATPAEIAAGYTSVDGKEDFEFIEIQNTGSAALPLQGLQFTNGVTFTFPNVTHRPRGDYMIVASDKAAFDLRYGAELQAEFGSNWQSLIVAGQYSGHLDNSGEEIQLSSPDGGVLQDFTYSPDWYPQTAGGGFSLTVRSTTQAQSLWSSAAGWEPSGEPGGTPGTAELISTPLPGSIVINEVLANPLVAGGDMIELHNTTSQADQRRRLVAQRQQHESDHVSNRRQHDRSRPAAIWSKPMRTTTAPDRAIRASDTPFRLNPYGFDVFLSSNANGVAGGYQESQSFGASPPGISAGLITDSTAEHGFRAAFEPDVRQPAELQPARPTSPRRMSRRSSSTN